MEGSHFLRGVRVCRVLQLFILLHDGVGGHVRPLEARGGGSFVCEGSEEESYGWNEDCEEYEREEEESDERNRHRHCDHPLLLLRLLLG